jgi:hypothetical protein
MPAYVLDQLNVPAIADSSLLIPEERASGRILAIDATRGLLILLMTSSHAVGLSGIGSESFFSSTYWLPRGWAMDGFVLLSGITVAMLWDWSKSYSVVKRTLHSKALRLLIVMFVSNLTFLLAHHALQGQADKLKKLSWWVGLVTFQTPYSISGVLLPIALSLLLFPYLTRLGERLGWLPMSIGSIFANAMILGAVRGCQGGSVVHSLITFGAGFPVIPMIMYGTIGLALGMVWRSLREETISLLQLRKVCFLGLMAAPFLGSVVLAQTAASLLPMARVLVLMFVALTLASLSVVPNLFAFFCLLGRFSLFCFIAHRILIQSTLLAVRSLGFPPVLLYFTLVLMTLILLGAICCIRMRQSALDRAFKRIYL